MDGAGRGNRGGLFDVWAVWAGGDYVGHAEIKPTGNVDGHEAVCALTAGARGRGLGTELLIGILAYGFDELHLAEVHGMVGALNSASLALIRKAGFEQTGEVVNDDGTITHVVTAKAANRPATRAAADAGNQRSPSSK